MLRDLRYAIRALTKNPGFAAAAILTLALGIGANTAIFSVVRAVLLRPLDYGQADRLVAVFASEREGSEPRNPLSPANYRDIRERSRTLEEVTAATPWSPTLTGSSTPEIIRGLRATPGLFTLLGVAPALGRPFTESMSQDRAVVLHYDLWRSRFGADPSIVGSSLTLDGEPYTIVAVMPPGFDFPPFWATGAQIWTSLHFTPDELSRRGSSYLRVFARLIPGATVEEAQRELAAIGRQLASEYPDDNENLAVVAEALREPVVSAVRPALLVLFGAVALVLLIACSNVANLLLGRALARRREFVVRFALGADRSRLVRQGLTESLVLSLAGGAFGLLLAVWLVESLRGPGLDLLPRGQEIGLDWVVVGYALLLSVVTALLFGVLPSLRLSRPGSLDALRSRSGGPAGRGIGRRALAAFEISLALVLLIGAGLLIKSFLRLQAVDVGFRTDDLQTMSISLAASPNGEAERQDPFFTALLERVGTLPGVRSAAIINHLPIAGDTWRSGFTAEGSQAGSADDALGASMRVISPGYFSTMGIPLLQGRDFDGRDHADAAPAVIVNESMARLLWGAGEAVGGRVRLGDDEFADAWLNVVGVVGDTRYETVTAGPLPEIYYPLAQNPFDWYRSASLVLHHAPQWAGSAAVMREVWALDGNVPVSDVRTMEEILAGELRPQRLNTLLLILLAGAALLLAIVGVYGVISFLVTRRTHEIGVRVALGARAADVARLVMRESLVLTASAVGVGLAVAALLTRYLGTMLFGVSPLDPWVFGGTALLIAAVALAATMIPARRAMRVQPMVALREE
ncbi:MAG TPA: ABC transporter permease [Longimicrobiaceae bacterium]